MTVGIDKAKFFASIEYEPHEGQQLYHASTARFRIPVCGRRFGKSHMAGRDEEVNLIMPRFGDDRYVCWIVGPTYDLGEKEFRVIWDDLIVGKRLGHDKRIKRAYNKRSGELYINFPWNVRIEVRSATHPETLVGEGLDKVIMSEAAKHSAETWERFIRPALADRRGSADFPTTPEGHNWLYLLWQLGRDPKFEGLYEAWNFPSWLNPHVYPGGFDDEEVQLLKLTMGEEEFAQEIGADFSSFSGKIYGEFDENVHVTEVAYNPALPNYVAFDWGFTNPLAAIEFQVDAFDNVYVWREYVEAYKTLDDHFAAMNAREQPPNYKVDCCFGDAADPEATLSTSMKFAPCISLPEAKANWHEGVDLVKQYLKKYQVGYDEYDRPIEKPKYYVDHSCKMHIREFNTYKKRETGIVIVESNTAGGAVRHHNDTLDAMRYALMHIFKLGVMHHLDEVMVSGPKSDYDLTETSDFSYGERDSGLFVSGKVF